MKHEVLASAYAIFQTGGKQYQAVVGATLAVEKLQGNIGDAIDFDQVLFRKNGESCEVGQPYLQAASIKAVIIKHMKGPKVIVFRFKRRKSYRKKHGHRQESTVVRFESVL